MSNSSGFLTLISKKKNHRTIIIEQESVFFNNNPLKLQALPTPNQSTATPKTLDKNIFSAILNAAESFPEINSARKLAGQDPEDFQTLEIVVEASLHRDLCDVLQLQQDRILHRKGIECPDRG